MLLGESIIALCTGRHHLGLITQSLYGLTFPRYANDASLNRDLKEVSRWNDPAANFLTVCDRSSSHVLPINQPQSMTCADMGLLHPLNNMTTDKSHYRSSDAEVQRSLGTQSIPDPSRPSLGRCRYVLCLSDLAFCPLFVSRAQFPDIHAYLSPDRGTGFEAKWFQNQNAKKRMAADAYAWGSEDM